MSRQTSGGLDPGELAIAGYDSLVNAWRKVGTDSTPQLLPAVPTLPVLTFRVRGISC